MADDSTRVPQQTHPAQGGAGDPNRQMEAANVASMEERQAKLEKEQANRTPDGSNEDKNAVAYGGILGGSKVFVPKGLHDGPSKDAPFTPPRHNDGEWATPNKSKASSSSSKG